MMKICQQVWNDLLMTPTIPSVTTDKYTENGLFEEIVDLLLL